MRTKKLEPKLYEKYMLNLINEKNNLDLDIHDYRRLMETIEQGNKVLIEDGYTFKCLGIRYKVYEEPAKIFKDVRFGELVKSKAYTTLKVDVPRNFLRNLKEKTRRESEEIKGFVGISKEERKEILKSLK